MRFGPQYKITCCNISIEIDWKSEIRFLGVFLYSTKSISINFQIIRQKYFRALNGIFAKVGTHTSAMVLCSLINSFCLPILCYGLESFNVTKTGYNSLESAFSTAFFKIFRVSDSATTRQCQYYCNMLPLSYVLDLRKMNFMTSLSECNNTAVSFLFYHSGKAELNRLMIKYNVQCSFVGFKGQLWKHFTNALCNN